MSAVICVLCLLGACVVLAFGLSRLPAAVLRIRHYTATRPIRDAAFVAQARAEMADRDHSIAMLDQQDTQCADDFPGYAEFFLDDSVAGQPEVRHG